MRSVFIGILFSAIAFPVRAALPDEIQVYTDDLRAPRELGLELHVNGTPKGRRTPEFPGEVTPGGGLRITPEFSLGLWRDWDAGLYLPIVQDSGGNTRFAGPKLRLKWLPLRPGESAEGWFAGVNTEYAWLEEGFEPGTRKLELRPILGWRSAQWLLAVNPILSWQLNGPERSGRPDFNPAFKVARSVTQDLALGLEYYAGLGPLGQPLPGAEQAHTLYLALEYERGPIPLHFAIGRGLNSATDRLTLKAIFEIPIGKP